MGKLILIVDDDPDILEPMELLLEDEGYHVNTTAKAEETYKKVQACKPDIILLDILMSGNDGRTICRKLKENPKTKNIPVVMMSAHPSAQKDAKDCGADDFLAKPFEIDDLLQILHKNLI